jgi:hypothetical protein
VACKLPGQPFAAVHADLHVKGKIGLEPQVHESEVRVQVVFVNVQALAGSQLQSALVWVGRTVVLEAHARLDDFERADQSRLGQRMLPQQVAGEIFLAGSW